MQVQRVSGAVRCTCPEYVGLRLSTALTASMGLSILSRFPFTVHHNAQAQRERIFFARSTPRIVVLCYCVLELINDNN
jgi:hypothetical protein